MSWSRLHQTWISCCSVHKRSGCLYGKHVPEWPSISDSQLGGSVLEWFTSYLSSSGPRNLGWLRRVDADPRLQVPSCFVVLGQLRSIRRSVSPAVIQSLVVSLVLVLSRLNYGNTKLDSLPGNQLNRMQTVINGAARLVGYVHQYEHITPLLSNLHWLPVHVGIEFRLAVSVFRCLRGRVLPYLANELCRVADSTTQEDGCVLRQRLLS